MPRHHCLPRGRPSVCRAFPPRYSFIHRSFLGRECSLAMIISATDALQGNVRKKRSLRPERGHCRKWSICDGRQENVREHRSQRPWPGRCRKRSFGNGRQENVQEKRSQRLWPRRCRKRSFGDGRQENFFRLQAVLAVNRRPSEARLDSRQGLIKCLKKFLGHRRAQRRQCLGHKPSPFARTPAPTNLNGLPSS